MNKQKEDIQILVSVLGMIPEDIQVESITSIEVNKNEFTQSRTLKASKRMSMANLNQYNELKAQLAIQIEKSVQKDQIQNEFDGLLNTLKPVYEDGDKFHGVEGVEKLTIEGENVTVSDCEYKPIPGIVTLVDFWATWCGPCQKPMAHNQHLLETHPEWKDKVNIVGVSMDDELPDLTKKILSNNWTSVEHYRIKNGWDDNNFALKSLRIRGIPFIILLNKENQIVYHGHPSKVKLEEKIVELIAEEISTDDKQQPKQEEKQELQQNAVLLEKEHFKILKQTAKAQLLEALKKLNDETIQINITAIKRNQIQRDGQKTAIEKSPLKLSYEIDIVSKDKIDSFIKATWEILPETHRVLGKVKVNDPEGLKNQIKLKIQETAAQSGINVQYNTEITTTFEFNNEKQSFDKKNNTQYVAQVGSISVDDFKKFEESIKGFLETLEDEEEGMEFADNIIQDIKKGFQIGVQQKFQTISDYQKLDGEFETINHKEGQVMIIDYWANWCGPCVAAMPKNVKMLNDHKEQWGSSVRLVALSLVLGANCKPFMEEKKEWQNVIEYYFPKEEKQIDCTTYGVQYIPHYVIVDKFGVVRHTGSIKNLADLVNKLLAEEEHKQIEVNNKQGFNQEQSQQLSNFLISDQISQLTKDLGKVGIFDFNLQFSEQFVQEGEATKLIKSSKPKLTYFIRQNKLGQLKIFLDKIFSIAPKDIFEIDEQISKTIDIPFPGIECVLCKKPLGDQVQQYYSPFKTEFVCCECAEFDDKTQKGLKRYKYTDSLIFINAPLIDKSVLVDIDDHKIGKNLKIQPDEEGSQKHSMMCNGKCQKQEEGPRYISVTSRPGKLRGGGYTDYCSGCFTILKNKDSDEAKAIVAYDAKDGMTSDSLFLRVLFNLGYSDF